MGIVETRETVRACKHCFMCRYISPHFLSTRLESCTPRGYGILLSEIDDGKRDWSEEVADKFYQCTLGGECKEDCFFDWSEDQMIRDAREEIIKQGMAPSYVTMLADNLVKRGSLYREDTEWNIPDEIQEKKKAEVLYFAGSSTRKDHPEIIQSVLRIFNTAGLDWTVLEDEPSSGIELFDLGYTIEARAAANQLVSKFTEVGASVIVTGCPYTYRGLKEFFSKWNLILPDKMEIKHISEFIGELITSGKIKPGKNIKLKTVYHDNSYLGRKMQLFDAPRKVLQACLSGELQELYFNRNKAQSSGAGAVMFLTHPELAADIAGRVLEEAVNDGVKVLVTASQNSKTTFIHAKEKFNIEIEVMELSEIVAESL